LQPQAQRFCNEWRELCAEKGQPLDWQPDSEQLRLTNVNGADDNDIARIRGDT
jgi:hypothetical protein